MRLSLLLFLVALLVIVPAVFGDDTDSGCVAEFSLDTELKFRYSPPITWPEPAFSDDVLHLTIRSITFDDIAKRMRAERMHS